MDVDLVFSVSGEMSALHSAEFDDISVNLADDDNRMTIEGRRFVLLNTAAAMQAQSSNEHLSVCLSVKHVDCDKTKQISVDILIPYERSIHLVF